MQMSVLFKLNWHCIAGFHNVTSETYNLIDYKTINLWIRLWFQWFPLYKVYNWNTCVSPM